MRVYNICIPEKHPLHDQKIRGEYQYILLDGVRLNNRTQLVNDDKNCDYIFLDFRHYNYYDVKYPSKSIMIDYRDRGILFPIKFLKYFRRSVVKVDSNYRSVAIYKYNRKVIPISYCIKECYMNLNPNFKNRDVDIAMFYNIDRICPYTKNGRKRLANFLHSNNRLSKYNIEVGETGGGGSVGRNFYCEGYIKALQNSKIVVSCNPDYWEGDSRLFEALASGTLVFVDRMITPIKNRFTDKIHLLYYDLNDLEKLVEDIEYYLRNEDERVKIAMNGYKHANKYHTVVNRIDEIIDELEK